MRHCLHICFKRISLFRLSSLGSKQIKEVESILIGIGVDFLILSFSQVKDMVLKVSNKTKM